MSADHHDYDIVMTSQEIFVKIRYASFFQFSTSVIIVIAANVFKAIVF